MHWQTPLLQRKRTQGDVLCSQWLKMECWQPVGSFKIRGIGAHCRLAFEQGAKKLISSSGGNAGLATAYAGQQLGIPVTVVVPELTSEQVRSSLRDLNAEVEVVGQVWDEADQRARQLAEQSSYTYISPFDHPEIWSGHATMIEECAQQGPKPDAVVLSVGGGGLMCGVLQGMHTAGWQDIPLIAAETDGAASLHACIKAGRHVSIATIETMATSLGAKQVASQACNWLSRHPVISCLVSDKQALRACINFADEHRSLVEPACGAALAAADQHMMNYQNLLVVVCGGIAVNLEKLAEWRERCSVLQ